jgi:hypothetical protein
VSSRCCLANDSKSINGHAARWSGNATRIIHDVPDVFAKFRPATRKNTIFYIAVTNETSFSSDGGWFQTIIVACEDRP